MGCGERRVTLRSQIQAQGELLLNKNGHIADLNQLITDCTGQLSASLDKQVVLQQRINRMSLWSTIKTGGLIAMAGWAVINLVSK
jgi:hypothetical protein